MPPEPEPESPHGDPPWIPTATADSVIEPEASAEQKIEALRREVSEVAGRLLQDFPDRPDSLAIVGNMHAAQGNSARALKAWEGCLELDPNRADVYKVMGEVALRKGEVDQALALWRKAQQIDPKMPGIHYCLARALMHFSKPDAAAVELEKELEISPGSALYHYLLGRACLQLKNYDRAKQNYEQAIQIQPALWNAYYGLATVYARLGRADKSKEFRDKFKQLKSADLKTSIDRSVARDDLAMMRKDVAVTYTEAALLYRRSGDGSRAERQWLRAAMLDPGNIRCRECLASSYRSTGREHAALEICGQLRKLDPQNPVYCVNLGIANARLKRFEAAEKAFLAAQQLAPQRSLGYLALAQLYLSTNRELSKARALAQEAVRLEPVALNYFVLGEAHDKNGDRQSAIIALRRAVQLDPENSIYRRSYELLQEKD